VIAPAADGATARFPIVQLWRPAALFAGSRLVVLFAFITAGAAHPGLGVHGATVMWDAGFYLNIIIRGYPSAVGTGKNTLAFFPALPALGKSIAWIPGLGDYRAGMIVVFAAGFAAACLLWLLTRELADADAADRATALFVFSPGAFVFSMMYSEAVLLCFSIAACWAFIRRRWILGGVLAAFASATRPSGIALVVVALCSLYVAHPRPWRAFAAPILAASGAVGFMLYLWAHTGDLFAWFTVERRWGEQLTPLGGRIDDFRSIGHWLKHGGRPDWNHLVPVLGLLVFIAAFVVLLRWKPPIELIAFAASIGFLTFTSKTLGFRPRFVTTAFPLFMALGVRLKRGPLFSLILSASAGLMVMLAIVTVTTKYLTP